MADNDLERTRTMTDLSGMTNPAFLKDEDLEYVPNEEKTTKRENLEKGAGVGSKDGPCGVACSDGAAEGCGRGCSGSGMKTEAMMEVRQEKLAIIKNLLVISLAFVCLFTSYNAVLSLQSSLNKEMGTAALVALYVAMVISCCLLPTYIVRKLGEKWTLMFSAFSYLGYYLAQFYPRYYTLVPAAFVLGIGAAPLWSAKSTYVTKVAERYAKLTNQSSELVITRFFGIFFLFFQSTNIWGNLISSTVLSTGVEDSETEDYTPGSNCGYHFCIASPSSSSSSPANASHINSNKELSSQQYIIFTVFLVCGLLSSLVVFFVDPLTRFVKAGEGEGSKKSEGQLIVATFNHMRHPYQLLLLPITAWSGLEQQFLTADYAAAYVSCSLGVHRLGFVLIAHGVSDSLSCLIIASLMKQMGRVPGFVIAACINLVLLIVFVYWYPSPQHLPWFFICAALWGLGDAVWQTQINALYSVIFPDDSTPAAFSNYRLWESVGMIIANASSTALCVDSKITVNLIFLVVGMAGYAAVEVIERKGGLRTDREGVIVPIDKLLAKSL